MDDRTITSLSGRFRGSRHATDVLAFPSPLHEIIISLDTARRQARARRVPLLHELVLLVAHGLLHLSGFRDETIPDALKMRQVEFESVIQML